MNAQGIIELTKVLTFTNLDLLSVGITIAAIALLGFTVYISNTKSTTNISFVIFCIVTVLWSFFNYISYQTTNSDLILSLWKIVIFLAIWHSFSFFNFLYVFPREKICFPFWYKYMVLPYIVALSLWALLGDMVFSGVHIIGGVPQPVVEKTIIFFVVTVLVLIISSFVFLIRRIIKSNKSQKKPFIFILIGALLTFALLFTANLILPAIFEITRFIPLGAVTIFPFSAFTAYAIYKHKTFKVKKLGSSIMAFGLSLAAFVEVIFAESLGQLILRLGLFFFVLLISIQFVKNIFELERIKESLEDVNVRLKSLDTLKSEFISLASHQLRSPLTVIKGYASTLSDGMVGELTPKQNELIHHIYSAAQGLANVVEDFLNVTKIEQGGMKYVLTLTDIGQIATDLAQDMKILAEDKHLSLTTNIDASGECMVTADSVKLRQVFLNLIDNSIKYTTDGYVKISVSRNNVDHTVTFAVSDSGIGINSETRDTLFQKFGRGEGMVMNSSGSGLGLYLAQQIVTFHKGTITVNSDGDGKGSTFSVVLPIA